MPLATRQACQMQAETALAYHVCLWLAGTTIAGVHELEKAGIRAAFMNAVVAAANKADELAKM